MMAKYGIKNVRGGEWCRVKMHSKTISELNRKIRSLQNGKQKKDGRKNLTKKGYCIRCRDSKDFDIEKPFCINCYRDWQYEVDEYFEDYCHSCGKFCNSHIDKPLCLPCWKKKKPNKIAKVSLYNFIH